MRNIGPLASTDPVAALRLGMRADGYLSELDFLRGNDAAMYDRFVFVFVAVDIRDVCWLGICPQQRSRRDFERMGDCLYYCRGDGKCARLRMDRKE